MPSVIKATAIVNGEIITQTDIDQRLALLVIANGGRMPAEEMDRLRQQVLRNLIDETLQIQAAEAEKITIKPADIDRTLTRVARNNKQTVEQLSALLEANGSSINSMRRQIEGEIAWTRLQRAKIESSVSVGEDEVKAVLDRMNASKGTEEFRVGEIFLSANAGNETQTMANANKILEQLRDGASFAGYARQYSEASTAAVGGDLGWVRPEQLPDPIAATLRQMGPGQISNPIPVQGGYLDRRRAGHAQGPDRRPARRGAEPEAGLGQLPQGHHAAAGASRSSPASPRRRATSAAAAAPTRSPPISTARWSQSDQAKIRDLPAALQRHDAADAGRPGDPAVRIDRRGRARPGDVRPRRGQTPSAPTHDEVYAQLNEERVNLRARRYLRDLRRDAVIEFR